MMTRDKIETFVAEMVSGYGMEPEDAAALHELGKLALRAAPTPLEQRVDTAVAFMAGAHAGREPCEGVTTRWCPNCGTCTCNADQGGDEWDAEPGCPIHGTGSRHDVGRPALVAAPPADLVALVQEWQRANRAMDIENTASALVDAERADAELIRWTPAAPPVPPTREQMALRDLFQRIGMVRSLAERRTTDDRDYASMLRTLREWEGVTAAALASPVGKTDDLDGCTCNRAYMVRHNSGHLMPKHAPHCARLASPVGETPTPVVSFFARCGSCGQKPCQCEDMPIEPGENQARKCSGCSGRGVVGGYEPVEFGNTLSAHPVDVPCPDCKGSGETPKGK